MPVLPKCNTTTDKRVPLAPLQSGFTLMELIAVLAILGVIAAMAAPSMQQAIIHSRIKNATITVQSTLEQARAEAFITKKPITVNLNGNSIQMTSKDASNNDVVMRSQSFGDRVTVSAQSNISGGVRFYGKTVQDSSGNALADSNTGFIICYRGSNFEKVIVSVNANNTITTTTAGACS